MADEDRKNPLTGGPAVPAGRYLASLRWQKMQSLRERAGAAASGSIIGGGSSGGGGGTAVAPPRAVQGAVESSGGEGRGTTDRESLAARLARTIGLSAAGGSSGGGKAAAGAAKQPAIVVVNALGQIMQVAPTQSGVSGEKYVESSKLVRALQQIRQMENVSGWAGWVRGCVGGGCTTASEAS
jgi:hypothetical protein